MLNAVMLSVAAPKLHCKEIYNIGSRLRLLEAWIHPFEFNRFQE
jgi:hypothetical protein